MWKICRYFTHLNTFVYKDKRIYIELEDDRKIYSVKVMSTSNLVCLQVPLRSWTRLRTARMSKIIVRRALQIREKKEVKKYRESKNDEREHELESENLINRITKMEETLKAMEASLKSICDKLETFDQFNK